MKNIFLKLLLALMLIGDMLYGALTKTEVSELYVALFNRASEGEGNNYWQTSQPNVIQTADVMLGTPDAKEYFGSSLDLNQDFIEHIYKNTLNKSIDDDPEGIKYWTDALDNGQSRAEIVTALINAIKTYKDSTGKTKEAYDQFMNRVKVSNDMADKVYNVPSDYKISTSFNDGLPVTFDTSTIIDALELVDLLREDAVDNTTTVADASGQSSVSGSSNSGGSQSGSTVNNTTVVSSGGGQSTVSSSSSSSGGSQSGSTANNTLVANAGEDQNVVFGENVYFDASGSTSSKGTIVSYTWIYGTYVYVTKKSKKVVSSSKLKIGTFTITLKVTDDAGNTATDTVTITIHR